MLILYLPNEIFLGGTLVHFISVCLSMCILANVYTMLCVCTSLYMHLLRFTWQEFIFQYRLGSISRLCAPLLPTTEAKCCLLLSCGLYCKPISQPITLQSDYITRLSPSLYYLVHWSSKPTPPASFLVV